MKRESVPTVLRSDEPTIDLIVRARRGDTQALDALLQRCLPPLRRWAHGRLPATARGHLDTEDLVQEAAINAVKHLETFDPRHVGAMQAYLRRSVINRIRDEIRRVGRRPLVEELPDDVPDDDLTPLEHLIQQESYERYRAAIQQLRVRDREIIVARVEAQWTVQELAEGLGFRTANAARVATLRALKRLQEAMHAASSVTPPES